MFSKSSSLLAELNLMRKNNISGKRIRNNGLSKLFDTVQMRMSNPLNKKNILFIISSISKNLHILELVCLWFYIKPTLPRFG